MYFIQRCIFFNLPPPNGGGKKIKQISKAKKEKKEEKRKERKEKKGRRKGKGKRGKRREKGGKGREKGGKGREKRGKGCGALKIAVPNSTKPLPGIFFSTAVTYIFRYLWPPNVGARIS